MRHAVPRLMAAGLAAALATGACKTGTPEPARVGGQPAPSPSTSTGGPMADAKGIFRVPGIRQPFSIADVNFMSGMIPHHAQAVLIAGWAKSHGARADIQVLCDRMVIAQRDEIQWMRTWLRDRAQIVPDANATHHRMKMNGVEHDMLMPGMLSPEQLAELDKARGTDWDRLFLTFMIGHHEGAIKMVDELFASYGALQDDDVYKLASDMFADQTTEIDRMHKMLAGLNQ